MHLNNELIWTGWEKHILKYAKPDILEVKSLKNHVYMVTGANSGIGKEITTHLAKQGATVYMICRNLEKAQKARDDINEIAKSSLVHILQCDCSLEADVRNMWKEFEASELKTSQLHETDEKESYSAALTEGVFRPRLDGLVCNAGALSNVKTYTSEGVEITFAAHLLFGSYLLGSLAMETLEATPDSRLIMVSSGGMYNTKFPLWEDATSTGNKEYDGQFAYAYAKRGQVLLAEQWALTHPKVKVVSCHPGWTLTDGVDAAYGDKKSYLEPLRSLYQGAEGIIWLCMADVKDIEGGQFYLDRSPQVKHLAGAFFSEGSFTKNSPQEIKVMMSQLEKWANRDRPSVEESNRLAALKLPLKATEVPVDIQKFMGKWYVMANIPLSLEVGAFNSVENYAWNEEKKVVDVLFEYHPKGGKPENPKSFSQMRAAVKNSPTDTFWSLNPKVLGVYLPLGLSYLLLYVAPDDSFCIVGVPDRSALWIMTKLKPSVKDYGKTVDFLKAGVVSNASDIEGDKEKTEMEADGFEKVHGKVVNKDENAEKVCVTGAREIFEMDKKMEINVLKESMHISEQLGYDLEKVLMIKWTL
jgi:dehydrogenase/reductase SDR family protein 12